MENKKECKNGHCCFHEEENKLICCQCGKTINKRGCKNGKNNNRNGF